MERDRKEYHRVWYLKNRDEARAKCRRRYLNNREEVIAKATRSHNARRELIGRLIGTECYVCGYNRTLKCLDAHHVDRGAKLFSLSQAKHSSLTDIKALVREARKCLPLCKLCHAELHVELFSLFPKNPLDKHHNR